MRGHDDSLASWADDCPNWMVVRRGGGKGKQPPPPDYSQIAAANKEAAEIAAKTAGEQLAWAKTQYAEDKAANKEITDVFLPLAKLQADSAATDRARYESIYQPLEDKLAQEAADYATPQKQEQVSGQYVAAVDQQFELARQASEARLASFGMDPSSVRAGALDLGSRVQEAAAKAGAANTGRETALNVGRALRSEAVNVGKGYPGQVAQSVGTATQTGMGGIQANLATTASGASTMGTAPQYSAIQNQALGNWGDYSAKVYNAQQAARANQGSVFGAIGGLAGTALGGWASGGFKFAKGGAIPPSASPSHGAISDDVPVQVSAGEFVIPKDVVARKGTEFFDKFIEKTRNPNATKGKGAGAKQPAPQVDPDTMEALLASMMAPQQGAIPAGP